MNLPPPNSRRAAYTLIEVLIAAAILMVAVSAAALLARATVAQEEVNARIARCVNVHEQAARLYQLGLAPAAIRALLPADPAVSVAGFDAANLTFVTNQLLVPGLRAVQTPAGAVLTAAGTLEQADSTLTYVSSPDTGDTRTSTIYVLRPLLR